MTWFNGTGGLNTLTERDAVPIWDHAVEPRGRDRERSGSIDNIRAVTGLTFDSLVTQARGPVAVEFMSYGCVHCRVIEPILQEVAETISATEKVFRVNIAVEQELASDVGIGGTPTIVTYLNGREVSRTEGPNPTLADVMAAVTAPFGGRREH